MHIQINDRHLQQLSPSPAPIGLGELGCDRHIVENTKSAAPVGKRVVRPAGQIGPDTFARCPSHCLHSRAHRVTGPLQQSRTPWEPDFPHGSSGQRAATSRSNVIGQVGQSEFPVACAARRQQLQLGKVVGQPVVQ